MRHDTPIIASLRAALGFAPPLFGSRLSPLAGTALDHVGSRNSRCLQPRVLAAPSNTAAAAEPSATDRAHNQPGTHHVVSTPEPICYAYAASEESLDRKRGSRRHSPDAYDEKSQTQTALACPDCTRVSLYSFAHVIAQRLALQSLQRKRVRRTRKTDYRIGANGGAPVGRSRHTRKYRVSRKMQIHANKTRRESNAREKYREDRRSRK